MSAQGWRGLFGIDVIKDLERNAIHLIEINARQPASTSFEAKLQNCTQRIRDKRNPCDAERAETFATNGTKPEERNKS
jgi:hypothetical protein